jgi:choline monooxygenase
VCRHHAARICEGEGNATSFVCPYHQWTYNLDGRLIKATRLKGIEGFSAAKVHLPSYRVDTWGPLVFVNLTNSSATDISDPLQRPLADQVKESEKILEENGGWEEGEVPWRSLGHVKRRIYEIGCNWKVYSDNYLDGGYHIPHLHRGLNSELDMSTYETTLFDTTSVQTCVSTSERVGKAATYLYLFPNIAVNKYGLWMDTNVVLPLSVDRCVVIFDWYHKEANTRKEELLRQLDSSVAIQDEDVYISESVQNGLLSKTYDVGRYAPGVEIAAHHFHLLISNGVNKYLRDQVANNNYS